MELKPCPVCGCKPLLLSVDEVACVNGFCPVKTVATKKELWNIRADVISRDIQLQKELVLEHAIMNNMQKIQDRFPGLSD